jgi:hypothetical protein
MTAFDRFDPERRIGIAIDEIAAARRPDYLDDILRQTARRPQRPRWSFPERWLNVDTTFARPSVGRMPIRPLIVLLLLLALATVVALYAGSQRRLPPPVGPARNGQIVYGIGGDLYVRDSIGASPRLLLGGPDAQGGVAVSPDGQLIAYDDVVAGVDHVWVAQIDGSNPRQILDQAFTGMTAQWSYDSRSMVLGTDSAGFVQLWNAPADGSGAHAIKLDGIRPHEATWDPTRPGVLLVRGEDLENGHVDLFYVDVSGTKPAIVSKIDMPDDPMYLAPYWQYVAITFSPDGSTIAYALAEGKTSSSAVFRTHLMHRDGKNDRVVGVPDISGYNQSWPVFSPDGKTIAMESWTEGGGNSLAIAPSDLSRPAALVGPNLYHTLLKSWSPDGTRLLLYPLDTTEVYSIDPITKAYDKLPWDLDYVPGWQRLAP